MINWYKRKAAECEQKLEASVKIEDMDQARYWEQEARRYKNAIESSPEEAKGVDSFLTE